MWVADEGHGDGRWCCLRVQCESHSVLVVEPNLAFVRSLQLLVVPALHVPQGLLCRGLLKSVQLVATGFDDADRQAELMGLVSPYEREARVGELDLHTAQNMSPFGRIVNSKL